AEAPFDIETEIAGFATIINVSISDFSAKVRNGAIEFEFTLKITYRLYETDEFELISEIAEAEERPSETSSITIYIPNEGDDSWEIAKRLGESEEEIRKYNPDLVFPLSDKDRIIIYRQKV
ncbi:MAG: hypothetical protein J5836_01185, partial [Clostridia bacterium]|nr:hypothetical protein [Clostridia bacterium]